jgi:hypothetical protein
MITRLLLMVALVLAVAGAAPRAAHADWDDRPDPAEFEESLEPHGYWVDDAQFGHVWRPNTWWSWQPYVDGHWIWTSYGWTWASDEPWDWTFHYGRWGFSNLYGWVWTPGYVWGPAWVDWYWGDGYVGWVPLGPPGFAIVPTYWTYVRDDSFCSPRITNVVVVHERLPAFIVHHREQGWGTRHAPDFRDIEHVSRFRIERAADRPDHSIAPWVKHRIERGERVRERIADRGSERVLEHPGRERGPEHPGRNAPEGRGRPQPSDDGWRRPNERAGREPHVIDRGPRDHDADDSVMHGRTDTDDRMRGRPNDGVEHRGRDDDAHTMTVPHGRDGRDDDAFRRAPRASDADRGWARPAPRRSEPSEPPHSGQVERPGPSTGHRGGAGGPVFVERGHPGGAGVGTVPGAAPAPQGDVVPRGGNPGAGGATMQHGHVAGSPPAGER